jgi:hypothetical protein
METITLYRPIGIKELELIIDSNWKRFPPRLLWQPIFYPVLNEEYAAQIASRWNTADESSGYCGIVTAFDLTIDQYLQYTVQNVGGEIHEELWVPANELELFNDNISGEIFIKQVFFGEQFVMPERKELAQALLKFR